MLPPLRRRAVLRLGGALSGLAVAGAAGLIPAGPRTAGAEGFTLNGFAVEEPFATYWREHGGLAQQGFPISNRFPEKSVVNGLTYQVQYFERAVFELHPEYGGSENEVLLQLLGREQYLARYPQGAPGQTPSDAPGAVAFPETGKRLGGRFLEYWWANGGLRQQGLPLTDEFMEISPTNGQPYRVQYFERARFEHHPENQPPYDVLLGLLGSEQLLAKYPGGPGGAPTPTPPPSPSPGTLRYRADWAAGLAGWVGGADWQVAGGMLTNSGATGGNTSFILAPAQTPVSDYAVEAELQLLDPGGGGAAGALVRREQTDASGYLGGWGYDEEGASAAVIGTPDRLFHGGPELAKAFAPGSDWHTYRLEVRGNALRLLIDRAPFLAYANDRFPSGVGTSLWSRGARLNVRSFAIYAI